MKFSFKIELIGPYKRTNLYSFSTENAQTTEFEQFLQSQEIRTHKDFQKLIARLDNILNRYGCEENFFRYASKPTDPVAELAYGKLRLYCCVWSRRILIAGGGGIKTTRTYQENPGLHAHVRRLLYLSQKLEARIREKEVIINKAGLFIGNLVFDEGEI